MDNLVLGSVLVLSICICLSRISNNSNGVSWWFGERGSIICDKYDYNIIIIIEDVALFVMEKR